MNSARSSSNLSQNETTENSLLEWINSFSVDSKPMTFDSLFTGVALYEVLKKIDIIYWPLNKLQKVSGHTPHSAIAKISIHNFQQIVSGLELFYQDRQDAIINNQTVLYDLEGLVRDKDFATLIGIVELIMGVVVNSEDKHQYIEKILQLEEKTQEDLKKLIERSLTRLQMEFAEAS